MLFLNFIEKKSIASVLFFALLVLCLLHIPLASLPLGRDQGVWSSVGLALSQGGIFFKDILHFNLPGLGFSFAFFFNFTDDPRVATALISLLGSIVTVVAMSLLLSVSVSNFSAKMFALIFSLVAPPMFDYWNISQKDYLAGAFVLAASAFMVLATPESKKRLPLVFLAGFSVAIAAMYKPIFGLVGIPLALAEVFRLVVVVDHRNMLKAFFSLTALLLGFLSLMGTFVFYLYVNGALQDAYHALFQFAVWYSKSSEPSFLKMLVLLLASTNMTNVETPVLSIVQAVFWLPLVAYGLCLLFARKRWGQAYWLYIPVVFSLFSYYIQQKGFPYHAMPWVVCASACVAVSVDSLVARYENKSIVIIFLIIILWSIVVRNIVFSPYGKGLIPTFFGLTDRDYYLTHFFDPYDSPHPVDSESIASWVDENSLAGDTIVVWGMENQMYALSKRRFASRHHFNFFLEAGIDPETELGRWQAELRKQYMDDLRLSPPKFFLFKFRRLDVESRVIQATSISRVPGLLEFVQLNYRKVRSSGRLDVYQRQQ